jgi:alkylation response protein AidB-like acyl-CoA dehydrogenase
MGSRMIDFYIRNDREQRLVERAERLAERFARRASQYDESGTFPFENFEDLRTEGYLALPVPKRLGGEEISLYELVLVQERLAKGDAATALAVGWHLGITLNLRTTNAWPESLFATFCRDIVERGSMINSFATEPATGSPSRGGRPQTTARRVADGWQIDGRKTYSTLCQIADYFLVTAGIDGEDRVGEFLLLREDGIRVEETWNTLGMRATGSHDLILEQVHVPFERLMDTIEPGKPNKRQTDASGWLLHIPACYLGIALAARDFALSYASTYQPNSIGRPIAELPHVQEQIGRMEAKIRSARALLYTIADRWDQQPQKRMELKPDLGLVKYVVTNEAQQVVDIAMRVVGGASLSKTLPLERLYRDVRAGLHNPPMDDVVLKGLANAALRECDPQG